MPRVPRGRSPSKPDEVGIEHDGPHLGDTVEVGAQIAVAGPDSHLHPRWAKIPGRPSHTEGLQKYANGQPNITSIGIIGAPTAARGLPDPHGRRQ